MLLFWELESAPCINAGLSRTGFQEVHRQRWDMLKLLNRAWNATECNRQKREEMRRASAVAVMGIPNETLGLRPACS